MIHFIVFLNSYVCKEVECKGRQKQAKIEILVKRKEEKGRRGDNKLTIDSEK